LSGHIQEGIYYGKKMRPGKSLCMLFFRIGNGSSVAEVGNLLGKIWTTVQDLKRGKTADLIEVNQKHLVTGNLTLLVGYGSKLFSLQDIRRLIPREFEKHGAFSNPLRTGGGPVIAESRVKYAGDITENRTDSEDIVLQFIGDSEFITSRAAIETHKIITKNRNAHGDYVIFISRIYTGFQRDDGRSWLGFHDGVSNIPGNEREESIAIRSNELSPKDKWLVKGTYMTFMRIEINLEEWDKIQKETQEIIIGRDKITGCPLIDVAKGRPREDTRCPVRNTFEVTEKGNEIFREAVSNRYTAYTGTRSPTNVLKYNHITRAKVIEPYDVRKSKSYRIYRQGFEFLEPIESFPGYRIGLNFISFQNSPSKIFAILQDGFGQKSYGNQDFRPLEDFFYVRSAGIFLVPPVEKGELFPGMNIFLEGPGIQERSTNRIGLRNYSYRKD
jgi:Dyp-type peroxidase family